MLGANFHSNRVLRDSEFYEINLIEYLEHRCLRYIIAVPISHTMQREILQVKQWHTVSKGVEVDEFRFQHHDPQWTKPRRYVVVRQSISKRPKALGKQPSLFKDFVDGAPAVSVS
jgi:hypothetical protein